MRGYLKIPVGQALGIAFLCMKMCGMLDWGWGWILFPIILSVVFETADYMPYAITLTILKLCGVATLSWGWILLIVIMSIATEVIAYLVKQVHSEIEEDDIL